MNSNTRTSSLIQGMRRRRQNRLARIEFQRALMSAGPSMRNELLAIAQRDSAIR